MRTYILICLSVIFFASCGKKDLPSGVLKPDKMQAVFWDVLRADAFTFNYQKKDSTKNAAVENAKLQQQIFSLHHTSKEQFYSSYDFYKKHPDMMRIMLDSMISKANRDRQEIQFHKPVKKNLGDTTTAHTTTLNSIHKP